MPSVEVSFLRNRVKALEERITSLEKIVDSLSHTLTGLFPDLSLRKAKNALEDA